jgi:hypothetical protein
MVRKLFFWTALGVPAVFFLSPVVGVVATLLAFLLLGFAVSLLLYLLTDAWAGWTPKVGECVRIINSPPADRQTGKPWPWVPDMNATCGKTGTVIAAYKDYTCVQFAGVGGYCYHLSWLRPASQEVISRECQGGQSLRAAGRTFRTFALETSSGAVVGGLLGFLSNLDRAHSNPPPAVLVGMALGGLVGVLVAISRLRASTAGPRLA